MQFYLIEICTNENWGIINWIFVFVQSNFPNIVVAERVPVISNELLMIAMFNIPVLVCVCVPTPIVKLVIVKRAISFFIGGQF